jgi:phage shock protein E
MQWTILFLSLAALAACFLLGRPDRIPAETAAEHLRRGALLIDVRTPREFAESHLPNAVNIPLSAIRWLVPLRVRDKNRVLLLHGQMGVRSGLAKTNLLALGYENAFNVGSFARAEQIAVGE